jgi:glucose-1-phosphate adenylyltransferase
VNGSSVSHSVLCDGAIVSNQCNIHRAVIGVRARVRDHCTIHESVIMGTTRFESQREQAGRLPLGVGSNCEIRRAIVDMDARIGDGCRLVNERGVDRDEGDGWCIRDGILVVYRGAEIAPGTVV